MDDLQYANLLKETIEEYGCPTIFNTDQRSQFTADCFLKVLEDNNIEISMDGRDRALDNIRIERLWRSLKYEDIYLNFEERVEAIYGTPELTDKLLDKSSLYMGEDEWSYSLREGARELRAVWSSRITGNKLKDEISYVSLFVTPYVKFGYTFVLIIENATKVEENEDFVL